MARRQYAISTTEVHQRPPAIRHFNNRGPPAVRQRDAMQMAYRSRAVGGQQLWFKM